MVMPDGQTAGDRLGKPAEVLPHALADRLQSLETSGLCMGVDADAFGGAMIDRDEHRGLAFAGLIVRSVPHIASTVSGMMEPSWLRGPRGEPTRVGASKLFWRISRNTRRIDVRVPA